MKIDGKRFVRLTYHQVFPGTSNNGYNERLRHVATMKAGAEAYAVVCNATMPLTEPREIKSFDERTLVRFGEIRTIDGDEWGEMKARIRLRDFQAAMG